MTKPDENPGGGNPHNNPPPPAAPPTPTGTAKSDALAMLQTLSSIASSRGFQLAETVAAYITLRNEKP